MAVIEIAGLRKEYSRFKRFKRRRTVAVSGLDLEVPAGGVFGFLGPNGSGKTTTIRCLLGLVRPSSGSVRLLGADSTGALHSVIGRVGSIVEAPALYPGFSGRKNLQILARIDGIGRNRVLECLEIVGLAERGDDRLKTYSLGMRQRLGIAAALLRDPELLILDEPANGLDPAGIKEVRDLVRRLSSEGRTVFVSSHILSEVQQMCDHVAILSRGKTVATGSVHEVLSGGSRSVFVRAEPITDAARVLQQAGYETQPAREGLTVTTDPRTAADLTKALAAEGIYVSELRAEEADLETIFLELTQGEPGEQIR